MQGNVIIIFLQRIYLHFFLSLYCVKNQSWMDIDDQWKGVRNASLWVHIYKEKKIKMKGMM